VVVLDERADTGRGRLLLLRVFGQGLFRHGIGERLVVGQVSLPVASELMVEQWLVRGVE